MISDNQRIGHILTAIEKINKETAISQEDFFKSSTIQDAVLYNFLIIGEAASQISAKMREEYPEIPWKVMVGMRNILIHDYVQTNYELVWKTVQKDLPSLYQQLKEIYKEP